MPLPSGNRRRARRPIRLAGTVAAVAGGLLPLSGVAYADVVPAASTASTAPAAPAAPAGLTLTQSAGQAVLGAPVALTLAVTASADRAAHGPVVTEALPAGTTYVPGSVAPSRLVASVVGTAGDRTLVLSGFPDLAAGQRTAASVRLATTDPLGATLTVRGQAAASARTARQVPLRGGLPVLGGAPGWEESTPVADASATIDAYGVTVSDPGTPVLATPGAAAGRVTSTVTVTAARGLAPSDVTLDAYLPAGTSVAVADAGAPTGQPVPTVEQLTAVVDPAEPAVPALPVTAPAPVPASPPPTSPGAPAVPAVPPAPSAVFTHLQWTLRSVDASHPATLTLALEVPATGAAVLVVASGAVTPAAPPTPAAAQPAAGAQPGAGAQPPATTPVAAAAVPSSDAAVEVIPPAPAPSAPPTPAPPAPASPGGPAGAPPSGATALPPAVGTGFAAPAHLASSLRSSVVSRAGQPGARAAAGRVGALASGSGSQPTPPVPARDPFIAPWATTPTTADRAPSLPMIPLPGQPHHEATLTGAPAPLASTGAPLEQEVLVAALALIAGAALAAGAVARHRPLPAALPLESPDRPGR